MPIRSILVAVDFGEASARAVAVAGAIAAHCPNASLRLLHAESIEAPAYFTTEQIGDLERQRQATAAQAEQYLLRFGHQHTNVPLVAAVHRRAPVEAILTAAASVDLVVMGTHGRHGPKRWWLGSVAERVLRDITKPLLIVRAGALGVSPNSDHVVDRTLVHAPGGLRGDGALALAREIAQCLAGAVTDGRNELIDPALERTHATLLVAAMPEPRMPAWMTDYGEPLVRFAAVPILFVPEPTEGASR